MVTRLCCGVHNRVMKRSTLLSEMWIKKIEKIEKIKRTLKVLDGTTKENNK